jgi:hypothetical protein
MNTAYSVQLTAYSFYKLTAYSLHLKLTASLVLCTLNFDFRVFIEGGYHVRVRALWIKYIYDVSLILPKCKAII